MCEVSPRTFGFTSEVNMRRKIIGLLLLGSILLANVGRAEIEFIPKQGKLWVKAEGELIVLKSEKKEQNGEEYFALKLEDESIYILTGKLCKKLKKLEGETIKIEGLLRARVEFEKELIPSIEVKRIEKVEN